MINFSATYISVKKNYSILNGQNWFDAIHRKWKNLVLFTFILYMSFHLQNFKRRRCCRDCYNFSTKTKSIITDYFLFYKGHFSHRLKALSCCATKYNAFYHLNCHMCTPFIVKCDSVVVSFGSLCLCIFPFDFCVFVRVNSSYLWHR